MEIKYQNTIPNSLQCVIISHTKENKLLFKTLSLATVCGQAAVFLYRFPTRPHISYTITGFWVRGTHFKEIAIIQHDRFVLKQVIYIATAKQFIFLLKKISRFLITISSCYETENFWEQYSAFVSSSLRKWGYKLPGPIFFQNSSRLFDLRQ